MGIRYDRVHGFSGPRRWSFDVDELLAHVCYVGATAAALLACAVMIGAGRG